jgi:DNA processing protein
MARRQRASPRACDDCLRRTDLVAALAGRLDVEWRRREAPSRVLALADEVLVELGGAAVRRRWRAFSADAARAAVARAGLRVVCRCGSEYPRPLEELPDPPAVLHVAGRLEALGDLDRVGIVGARAATSYGREVARELGRTLALAGVGVVSGLALGIDATAHEGAILGVAARAGPPDREADVAAAAGAPDREADVSAAAGAPHLEADTAIRASADGPGLAARGAGMPVAVLAGGADRPYPARGHRLHRAVVEAGAVVSEMPPGFGIYRWAFIARNRIIAALSGVLVVVEAAERSGSLTTADFAAAIGRTVAAVPGRVTSRTAAGTNGLIRDGAPLVRGTQDVLDLLADVTDAPRIAPVQEARRPPGLDPLVHRVLDRIEQGHGTLAELARTPDESRAVLRALGELESRGLVARGFGGRYERAL